MRVSKAYLLGGVAMLASTMPLPQGVVAAELPNEIQKAGKVVVLVQPTYAPMEYRDLATNQLTGLDVDLQMALAKTLGVDVEWSESSFEQLIPSLITGRGNIIHSGMSDLPQRREQLDFVDYMSSGAQFFVSPSRKDEFKDVKDFCGKVVGMPKSTSFPNEVGKWSSQNCEANGLPAVVIRGNEGSSDTFLQLRQGRIDAGVQGSETLDYLTKQSGDNFQKVGSPVTSVQQGIGILKGNTGLRSAYVAALKKLMETAEYRAIFKKWSLEDAMLDQVYVNGEPAK